MAASSKVSFRSRAMDHGRPMRIYIGENLSESECTPIHRGVHQVPTGMEKEEEQESHLQDAILAQQASTSGVQMGEHAIPIPKVHEIEGDRYNDIYPKQPPPRSQLIKVHAWLSMEQEEAEYDLDSEDEEYLRDRPHIRQKALEKIIECLEGQSSENNICQPATARKVLLGVVEDCDESTIDDVYDYWLHKRKEAATKRTLGFGGLIPRVRNECRKENNVVNPYVAFRRRGEKMQTRKNRKNDEDSYEKVLKLGHDLRRAMHLFEMVKRREKTKLSLLNMDLKILRARATLGDFGNVNYNGVIAKLSPEEVALATGATEIGPNGARTSFSSSSDHSQPLREENGNKRPRPKKKSQRMRIPKDKDCITKEWLKKNAELWNQTPNAFINGLGSVTPAAEVDQSVAAANTANADGKFAFKRRRGCVFRAPVPLEQGRPVEMPDEVAEDRLFYQTSLPSTSTADAPPSTPHFLLRRRRGRGGRVIFDRLADLPRVPPRHGYIAGRTNCTIFDPFADPVGVVDDEEEQDGVLRRKRWIAVPRDSRVKDEDESIEACVADDEWEDDVHSSRFIFSSHHRPLPSVDHAVDEEEWMGRAFSPVPLQEAPAFQPLLKESISADQQQIPRPPPSSQSQQSSAGMPGAGPSPVSEHEEDPQPSVPDLNISVKEHLLRRLSSSEDPTTYSTSNGGLSRTVRPKGDNGRPHGVVVNGHSSSACLPTSDPHHQGPFGTSYPLHHPPPSHTGFNSHQNHVDAAHHLHIGSGNAVLSPPDSTAPSPRVALVGQSDGGGGSVIAQLPEEAIVAKLKPMAMEAASIRDNVSSSRESGCSPVEKVASALGAGVLEETTWPREPSNSPSESNSSADWPASNGTSHQPTRNGGEADARLMSSEEEVGARTGDHPILPAKPPHHIPFRNGVNQLTPSPKGTSEVELPYNLPQRAPFPLHTPASSLI